MGMTKEKPKTKQKPATKAKAPAKPKKTIPPKAKSAAAPKAKKTDGAEKKTPPPRTPAKPKTIRNEDPYFDGEKLFAVGGGRYIQYNGIGPMPEEIAGYMSRTGRKPPFMLLPETAVDFYLSKGFGGSSKVHWSGEGKLPDAVFSYLNDHGTLPRTRENTEEDEDFDGEPDEEDFE